MTPARSLLAFALALTACDPTDDEPDVDASAPRADAAAPSADVYQPPPQVTWQWQLQGDRLGANYPVDLYDIDLFDQDASAIAGLQAAGHHVLCYFSAGSSENWRPDFGRLPAATLGRPLDDWEGERWLDIRADAVWQVMAERLDLAREKGCEGVEPDNVDAWDNDTGFPITAADQLAFNRRLADGAHARGLAIALKNDGPQIPDLVAFFDLALNEQCHEMGDCEALRPFVTANKAALNVEYVDSAEQAATLAETVCPASAALGLRTLILPLELDDRFRVACD